MTPNQLYDYIAQESHWRKHELVNLGIRLKRARRNPGKHDLSIVKRSLVLLAYAHWEGFVKAAADAYLGHVAAQKVRHCDLYTGLVAASLKSSLREFSQSEDGTRLSRIVSELLTLDSSSASFLWKGKIDTRSNLNSDTFVEICALIGFDTTHYEARFNFIDRTMVALRHQVAHGRRPPISNDDAEELRRRVPELIEQFATDITNMAIQRSYLSVNCPVVV